MRVDGVPTGMRWATTGLRAFALACCVAMVASGCTRSDQGERIRASDPAKGTPAATPGVPANAQVGPPCAESDLRPSPGPAPMPAPVRLDVVETFPTATVTLEPPTPGDAPAASPQQAWANAEIEKRSDVRYEVLLARMVAQFPAAMGQGTATTPLYDGVLVWAVVTHRIPLAPVGGPPLGAGEVTRPGPPCLWADGLSFTDATTGQRMFSTTFGSGT